jgi:hypothetical protein
LNPTSIARIFRKPTEYREIDIERLSKAQELLMALVQAEVDALGPVERGQFEISRFTNGDMNEQALSNVQCVLTAITPEHETEISSVIGITRKALMNADYKTLDSLEFVQQEIDLFWMRIDNLVKTHGLAPAADIFHISECLTNRIVIRDSIESLRLLLPQELITELLKYECEIDEESYIE